MYSVSERMNVLWIPSRWQNAVSGFVVLFTRILYRWSLCARLQFWAAYGWFVWKFSGNFNFMHQCIYRNRASKWVFDPINSIESVSKRSQYWSCTFPSFFVSHSIRCPVKIALNHFGIDIDSTVLKDLRLDIPLLHVLLYAMWTTKEIPICICKMAVVVDVAVCRWDRIWKHQSKSDAFQVKLVFALPAARLKCCCKQPLL